MRIVHLSPGTLAILPSGVTRSALSDLRAARQANISWTGYPRPTNGIVVAVMVRNSTLVSSGSEAM